MEDLIEFNGKGGLYRKIKQWINPVSYDILAALVMPEKEGTIYLGRALLEQLSTVVPQVINPHWEELLWMVLGYLENFHEDFQEVRYTIRKTKSFILVVLCSPTRCPNPYLRLQMIGLMSNFVNTYSDSELAKLAKSFVITMAEIDIDVLDVRLESNLIFNSGNLKDLICKLCDRRLLSDVGEKILLQLEQNRPRREVIFFANLTKLIGRLTLIAPKKTGKVNDFKNRISMKLLIISNCLSLLDNNMIQLLKNDSCKFRKAYNHHIMLPSITNSISDITNSILTTHTQILSSSEHGFVLHSLKVEITAAIRERDTLLNKLNLSTSENTLPLMHLQWQHGGYCPQFKHKFMKTASTFKFGECRDLHMYNYFYSRPQK